MRVLVACEESQEVTFALRCLGITAFSCDIIPCSGGFPEWHIQENVLNILEDNWGALIAFPPCTHLTWAGISYFEEKRNNGLQLAGVEFFHTLWNCPIKIKCLENPKGIISSDYMLKYYPKFGVLPYTQILSPHYFGDEKKKMTCLWLSGLPVLLPTCWGGGKTWVEHVAGTKKRAQIRSKLSPFLAQAMAQQWADYLR